VNPHDVTDSLAEVKPPARFVGPNEAAELCVILVNYNTAHLLERCIGQLRIASADLAVRVVIVDNASRDGSATFIRERFTDCVLLANDSNIGFGRANNQALAFCDAPYVLCLNVDAFVFADTLSKCLGHMAANPRCGVLGVRLVDEAGHGIYRGRPFPDPWQNFLVQTGLLRHVPEMQRAYVDLAPTAGAWECDWVVGCFYLTRREVIQQVGLFDPRYFLYFEEVDHCRAVWHAGWRVECLADASAIHIGGASAESDGEVTAAGRQISSLQIESELLYFRKHNGLPGLVLTVTLALIADAVRAIKWVVKRRRFDGLEVIWRNTATVCRLAWQTRLGSRATR
jgi:GT2 family glycosyltransferase